MIGNFLLASNISTICRVQEKRQRRGYMGHLIKIANLVVDQVEKCSLRPILAKQLSPEVLAVWEEFVKCTLSEINKTHNIALVRIVI